MSGVLCGLHLHFNCAMPCDHLYVMLLCCQINIRVNRESQESKVADLMHEVDTAEEEMKHRYAINQISAIAFLSRKMDLMKDLSFMLAIAINIIILLVRDISTVCAVIASTVLL